MKSPRWQRPAEGPAPSAGTYQPQAPDQTSKMVKSPRFGFGSSKTGRLDVAKEQVPGPGAYSHKEFVTAPGGGSPALSAPRQAATPIRRAAAEDAAGRTSGVSPDFWTYQPQGPDKSSKMSTSPSFGFGSSRTGRLEQDKERVPGPGAYSAQEYQCEKRAVLHNAPRRREAPKGESGRSPGPGAYDIGPLVGHGGPKYSVTPRRDARPGEVPGPGAYNGEAAPAANIAPSMSSRSASRPNLGSQTKLAQADIDAPGPGHYAAQTSVGEGPKFTMSSRVQEKPSDVPGPGAYGGPYTQFS